jgi:preprotein translocase subunit SecA
MLSKAIERAQKRVEGRNFDIRRRVLEYDDVLNQQRELIYRQRRQVLDGEDLRPVVLRMAAEAIERAVDAHAHPNLPPEDWDLAAILELAHDLFLPRNQVTVDQLRACQTGEQLTALLQARAEAVYTAREAEMTPELMRSLERLVLLRTVDSKWMTHLDAMDDLREGIGLRAYGQKDPLLEYKFEAYEMFEAMIVAVADEVTRLMFHLRVEREQGGDRLRATEAATRTESSQRLATASVSGDAGPKQPVRRAASGDGGHVGRNDPCPCGSGKKYKRCCGRNER